MKLRLIVIGKTKQAYIEAGLKDYSKRLTHYLPFEIVYSKDIKHAGKLTQENLKEAEGELLLKQLVQPKQAWLLDVKGKSYSSKGFAQLIQNYMNQSMTTLDFVIGGAYGFSQSVYDQVPNRLSFSSMTLSHELIRLVFTEQLYRAMTILRNEPYHHE